MGIKIPENVLATSGKGRADIEDVFDSVEVPASGAVHPIIRRGAEAVGVICREGMAGDHLECCTLKLARTDGHHTLCPGVKSCARFVGKGGLQSAVVVFREGEVQCPFLEHLLLGREFLSGVREGKVLPSLPVVKALHPVQVESRPGPFGRSPEPSEQLCWGDKGSVYGDSDRTVEGGGSAAGDVKEPRGMGEEDQDSAPGGESRQGMKEGGHEARSACRFPGPSGGEQFVMDEDGIHPEVES
jgi:hypothetical protein